MVKNGVEEPESSVTENFTWKGRAWGKRGLSGERAFGSGLGSLQEKVTVKFIQE